MTAKHLTQGAPTMAISFRNTWLIAALLIIALMTGTLWWIESPRAPSPSWFISGYERQIQK
jgi:hypothetical protein